MGSEDLGEKRGLQEAGLGIRVTDVQMGSLKNGVGVRQGMRSVKYIYLLADSSCDESIKKKKKTGRNLSPEGTLHFTPLPQSFKRVLL